MIKTDHYGREIKDGDIVMVLYSDMEKLVTSFKEGVYQFKRKDQTYWENLDTDMVEVIGNIYKTPKMVVL